MAALIQTAIIVTFSLTMDLSFSRVTLAQLEDLSNVSDESLTQMTDDNESDDEIGVELDDDMESEDNYQNFTGLRKSGISEFFARPPSKTRNYGNGEVFDNGRQSIHMASKKLVDSDEVDSERENNLMHVVESSQWYVNRYRRFQEIPETDYRIAAFQETETELGGRSEIGNSNRYESEKESLPKNLDPVVVNIEYTDQAWDWKVDETKATMRPDERVQVVMLHNAYRRFVNPSAVNMVYLVYNNNLEMAAISWAKQCNTTKGVQILDPDEFAEQGMSQATGTTDKSGYNWKYMIDTWFKEGRNFDYENIICKQGTCANYLTVSWATSRFVGCSVVFCTSFIEKNKLFKNVYNYVCFYSPRGNLDWGVGEKIQPYRKNLSGKQCPEQYPVKQDRLCRADPFCRDVLDCYKPINLTICLCPMDFYKVTSGQTSIILHEAAISGVSLVVASFAWRQQLTLICDS